MKAVFHNTKKPPQRIQMKTHYFGKLMPVSVMKNSVGSRSVTVVVAACSAAADHDPTLSSVAKMGLNRRLVTFHDLVTCHHNSFEKFDSLFSV